MALGAECCPYGPTIPAGIAGYQTTVRVNDIVLSGEACASLPSTSSFEHRYGSYYPPFEGTGLPLACQQESLRDLLFGSIKVAIHGWRSGWNCFPKEVVQPWPAGSLTATNCEIRAAAESGVVEFATKRPRVLSRASSTSFHIHVHHQAFSAVVQSFHSFNFPFRY